MDLGLNGRIALVSGASGGIGRATAKMLAEEGAQTVIVARRKEQLAQVADEIETSGGLRPLIVVADLNQSDSFSGVREQVIGRFGYVDILVNNLGQARNLKWDSPDADWDEAFTLNFAAPRRLAREFIPSMRERKFGRIINLTSTFEPGHVSGSMASKAAVAVWAKGLSRVLGKDGITVNCLSPGLLMTEQIRNTHIPTWLPTQEERDRFLREELPVGRFGEPEDAARLICFLSSPQSSYITGQRIYVDGGWNRHV